MKMQIARNRGALSLIVVLLLLSAAGTLYGWSAMLNGWTAQEAWRKSVWRLQLFARKAEGNVPNLTWTDLWQMTMHRGGFGMERVPREAISLDGSVHNPYESKEDFQAGERLFRQHCAACHGGDGSGWHAPPLDRPGLRHGDTDMSIYQVLRDGVPGTPMQPAPVSQVERWRLVGYIRTLQLRSASAKTHDDAPGLDVRVTSEDLLAAGSRHDECLTYSGSLAGHRHTPL